MRRARLLVLPVILPLVCAATACRPREHGSADASASEPGTRSSGPGSAGEGGESGSASILTLLTRAELTTPDGVKLTRYSGYVPSFDGLPLDVDVTVPACEHEPCQKRPLVAFFHGWALDKKNWEADTVAGADPIHERWNNVGFVSRGYVALNYSIRGWHGSCGPDRAKSRLLPQTMPKECAQREYWVHVADPRWEIRDAQHLIGELVDTGLVDPARIGVTGGSYGGAHAWRLALGGDRAVNQAGEEVPWLSPKGSPLSVAVAAPQYTWANLGAALVPNGRAPREGEGGKGAPWSARTPIGVPLGSYLRGFFAGGPAMANAFYAPPFKDPSADFTAWYARFAAGAPFLDDKKLDAVLVRALDELDGRSPVFAKPHGKVPIIQVQGTTDPLFSAEHALVMKDKLRAMDAAYPIVSFFGDVGHQNAQNPATSWTEIHDAQIAFFDHYLLGTPMPALSDVNVSTTVCLPGQKPESFHGASFQDIAKETRTFRGQEQRSTTHLSLSLAGIATDPLLHSGCLHASAKHPPGSSWTFPVASGLVMVGAPRLSFKVTVLGADATLVARLFDVHGDMETLITRGVYRVVVPPTLSLKGLTEDVSFDLAANAWEVLPGHAVRLEIVGNGAPELESSTLPFRATMSDVSLTLPVVR